MRRLGLAALLLAAAAGTAHAQYWGQPYGRGGFSYRSAPSYFSPFWGWDLDYRPRARGPALRSGGERPDIARLEPRTISFPSSFPVGSVIIDTKGRQLLYVTSPTEALHYPISVGREGFTWTGTEKISRKAEWPDWHPPPEMRYRDWRLPEKMTGGIKNPLGAMALYLGHSLYRIHGTNDPSSIGRAASSGCFRMLNGHIVDLASRVEIGTTVTVVHRLPPELDRVVAEQVPQPQPVATSKRARRG
jgi:lipoprotein-anchoring transpeptidase ErfK/SrfK